MQWHIKKIKNKISQGKLLSDNIFYYKGFYHSEPIQKDTRSQEGALVYQLP